MSTISEFDESAEAVEEVESPHAHEELLGIWLNRVREYRDQDERQRRAASTWSNILGWPAAVISALVSTTIFADERLRVLAGVLAAVVAVLTATTAWWNPAGAVSETRTRRNEWDRLILQLEGDIPRVKGLSTEKLEALVKKYAAEIARIKGIIPNGG